MYESRIENRGDATFHATSRGYAFQLGPKGQGANPGDTLLAALCACVGHNIREFLGWHGVASTGFAIAAEAQATPDESRLARVDVRIDLGVATLRDATRAALLAHAQRSRIHNTLEAACPVTVSLAEAAPPRGLRAASISLRP